MVKEYVWALHDFIPQITDEVAFKAGERIEVVEKDDLYQDGWWKVSISISFARVALRLRSSHVSPFTTSTMGDSCHRCTGFRSDPASV